MAAALKAAATTKTAETILLEGGTYSGFNVYNDKPTANVTIESASSSNKAVIEGLSINNSANYTFNDLHIYHTSGYVTGEIATSYYSNNISFTNDNFIGKTSSSYKSAPNVGLQISDSTNSVISGSTFQYVSNGVADTNNNIITISNNNFSDLFGDGIDNAGTSNVKLLSNSFTSLHIDSADAQHSDAIQFWTSGETTAGSNITISGNTYTIGSGSAAQGIFMTDQVGDLTYKNVTIENNDLVGTGWNGITLQHVSGALVENNTLQSVSSTGQVSRLTLDGGVSGLVKGNKIGQLINQNGNSATVSGNTILPAISQTGAAQSLVSGMASIVSSASAATALPNPQLAAYNAYLAAHPVSLAKP